MYSFTTTIEQPDERIYYVVIEYQWTEAAGVTVDRVRVLHQGQKYAARPWLHDTVCAKAADVIRNGLNANLVSHAQAVISSRALKYDVGALEVGR